jgi:Ni/Fe-hydrogenase subunit HybB-like protein
MTVTSLTADFDFKNLSTTGKIVLGILVALTALGLATGAYRLLAGLGATTNLSDPYPWGLWLGFDFTLIAFGAAAFTMAMVVHLLHLEQYEPVLKPAILTGFLGYISVLVILLIDLGRPDRFWGFIPYANVHSPLFEICWCILIYTIVLTLEISPLIFKRLNRPQIVRVIHAAVIPITLAGVVLSTSHQSTLGTMFLALPERTHTLWWTWLLPILYYLSAIGLGLSSTILVMIVGGKALGHEPELDMLAGLGRISVWVWVVYLVFRMGDLVFTGELGRAFAFDSWSTLFWIETLLMAVAPIVLYSTRAVQQSKMGLFWTALIVTLGLGFNRFNAMLSGRPVVNAGVGYFPSFVEFAVQIGVLAAAALVWYLLALVLPVFEEEPSSS